MRPILVFVLLLVASCSTTPRGRPMGEVAAEINTTAADTALVLSAGDVLSVRFSRLPDWNQDEVVIGMDGRASFLSLDDMRVAGMTLALLDEKLTGEYTRILAQPELTVRVTTLAPRNFFIMGEAVEGGVYEIPVGRLSLVEALGMAGGFIRDTARLDNTLLVRWIPEENRIRTWKIDARTKHWDAEEAILLQGHDVVYVPAQPVVHVNDWVDRYIRRNIPLPWFSQ